MSSGLSLFSQLTLLFPVYVGLILRQVFHVGQSIHEILQINITTAQQDLVHTPHHGIINHHSKVDKIIRLNQSCMNLHDNNSQGSYQVENYDSSNGKEKIRKSFETLGRDILQSTAYCKAFCLLDGFWFGSVWFCNPIQGEFLFHFSFEIGRKHLVCPKLFTTESKLLIQNRRPS